MFASCVIVVALARQHRRQFLPALSSKKANIYIYIGFNIGFSGVWRHFRQAIPFSQLQVREKRPSKSENLFVCKFANTNKFSRLIGWIGQSEHLRRPLERFDFSRNGRFHFLKGCANKVEQIKFARLYILNCVNTNDEQRKRAKQNAKRQRQVASWNGRNIAAAAINWRRQLSRSKRANFPQNEVRERERNRGAL